MPNLYTFVTESSLTKVFAAVVIVAALMVGFILIGIASTV